MDTILGQAGNDTITGGANPVSSSDPQGAGIQPIHDYVYGGSGEDTLTCDSYLCVSWGDADNDIIYLNAMSNVGYGGDGADSFTIATDAQLAEAFGNDGDDTLIGGDFVDMLTGGPGDDTLIGNGYGDGMSGDEGNDTLNGGPGSDTLDGGADSDICDGGPDTDYGMNCETVSSIP